MKEIHSSIKQMNEKLSPFINELKSINQKELDESEQNQFKIMQDNFFNINDEFQYIVKDLIEKEKENNRRLSFYSLADNTQTVQTEADGDFKKTQTKMAEGKLIYDDAFEVKENIDYMEERTRELEDIAKVTYQIKDITGNMKQEVMLQGEKLNKIEDDVCDAKENVVNADHEIKEAEIEDRKSCRRSCLIISLVAIIVIIILVVVLLVVL